MKQSCTVVTLTMAFGIMLIAVGPLGSVLAQTNTTANGASGNATGGGASGNATGGGASGNVTGGATTASEIENLTKGNTEALTNNTEVTDKATGLADLQKEQTSTDPNMTAPSG
jgi:pectate lyase